MNIRTIKLSVYNFFCQDELNEKKLFISLKNFLLTPLANFSKNHFQIKAGRYNIFIARF